MLFDELQDLLDRESAGIGNACGLNLGIGHRDHRVEPRPRRRDRVDRHRGARGETVRLAVRLDSLLNAVGRLVLVRCLGVVGSAEEEVLVGRPEVRTAAVRGRIVGRVGRLVVVVERARRQGAGRRGPGPEVLVARERLTEERRTHDLTVDLDLGAGGLVVEQPQRDPGQHDRIGEPTDHGEDEEDPQSGYELASHYLTPKAVMMMSMSLMPMNGAMIPPTP